MHYWVAASHRHLPVMNSDLPGSSGAPAGEGEGGGRDERAIRCCRDGNTGQGNGGRKGKLAREIP